ncbi:MAG: DUF998 domain-containing protein [Bacteroidales bacterium]|nr:DUF998 domain-containing protein [Bacteroidales bacterium]
MKQFLIKQAVFLPVIYFGFIVIAGSFAQDYSHVRQHASELGINPDMNAVILFKSGIILTSVSLFFLSVGLLFHFRYRFLISAILVFSFGVTFIFGTIFPIGTPWHGLYGFGLFIMILPFVFLYELSDLNRNKAISIISIAAGFLMFFYLWSMIAGLDPLNYRRLTQRLFGLVVFGWFSYISYYLFGLVKDGK